MKRIIRTTVLLATFVLLSCCIAFAADTVTGGGFYNIGTNENVTVTPSSSTEVAVERCSAEVDSAKDGYEIFFAKSDKMNVVYNGTVAKGDNFVVMLVEGDALPTQSSSIYYIDQKTVVTSDSDISFNVFPILPETTTDLSLYITSDRSDFTTIRIPLGYAVSGTYNLEKYKKAITPTVTITGTYEFSGSAITPTYTVKDGTTDLAAGDYSTEIGENINAGVEAGSVVITAEEDGNYSFAAVTKKFDIGKATCSGSIPDQIINHMYSVSGEQTADFPSVLPGDKGETAYAMGTVTDKSSILSAAPSVNSEGDITYTLAGKDSYTEGQTATIPVTAIMQNYNDVTVNFVITLKDKDIPTVTAKNITVTYNGESVADSVITGTATFNNETVPGSWSWKGTAPRDAVSNESRIVVFTPADADTYETAEDTILVTINKATPKGSPAYTAISEDGKKLADAALNEGSITPAGGTIAWDDPTDTTVAVNTAYGWTYTPADSANYNNLTNTITLWRSGGGSGGGGGGGGGAAVTPTTVPASSNEGSVSVATTVSGTTATVAVTDEQIKEITSDAATSTGTVKVDVSSLNVEKATIPANLVTAAAAASGAAGLEVVLPAGAVSLDTAALETVGNKSVTVAVDNVKVSELSSTQKEALGEGADNAVIVDVNVMVNGKQTSTFGEGKITVSVPYTAKAGEDTSRLAVWYLADDGTLTKMDGKYDSATKSFVFTTDHLSKYVLMAEAESEALPFTDVNTGDYFYDAVKWAVEENITSGTTPTTFTPNGTCTRAQAVTFLWRAAGSPAPAKTDCPFADVAENAYYRSAVLWAVEKGITKGTADTAFSPDATVTREQLATFLYKYEQSQGGGFTGSWMFKLDFPDAAQVSEWAYEAMCWCTMNDIITGTNKGTLDPKGTATRCQTVTILYRSMEK